MIRSYIVRDMNKDSLHATHRASITFIIDTSSWLQVHHQPISSLSDLQTHALPLQHYGVQANLQRSFVIKDRLRVTKRCVYNPLFTTTSSLEQLLELHRSVATDGHTFAGQASMDLEVNCSNRPNTRGIQCCRFVRRMTPAWPLRRRAR